MNSSLEEEFDIVLASKNENLTNFNFDSCELTEPEIAEISIQESIFTNAFRKYRNNIFEMCSSLAEIEKILKVSGKFMEWYHSKGLTKDMVSVLLKRWNLYIEFPGFKNKIFSLSDQAIKILTNKELAYEEVKTILEGNIFKAKEIKKLLTPIIEKNKRDFLPAGQKFFNFNKINKMKKRIKKLDFNEQKIYKEELAEYIQNLIKLQEEI